MVERVVSSTVCIPFPYSTVFLGKDDFKNESTIKYIQYSDSLLQKVKVIANQRHRYQILGEEILGSRKTLSER